MKKTTTIIIAIIILALLAVWFFVYNTPQDVQEEASQVLEEDTTPEIQEELDSLDLGDLDAEFEAIDAELEQL